MMATMKFNTTRQLVDLLKWFTGNLFGGHTNPIGRWISILQNANCQEHKPVEKNRYGGFKMEDFELGGEFKMTDSKFNVCDS